MHTTSHIPLLAALSHPQSSVRLRAALEAGTRPDPGLVEVLVDRCGVEGDFFVRDMLTWALTRLPATVTVRRLVAELSSPVPQARAQALHTLSKVGDRSAWPDITPALLHDADPEVARAAWRAAVALAPEGEGPAVAAELATELGRGDADTMLSLSRALIALDETLVAVRARAAATAVPAVRAHAAATERLLRDPDSGFALAVHEARRTAIMGAEAEGG